MNIGDGWSEGSALPLGDRYRVVKPLGDAKGQTYLARDTEQDDELCVVKSLMSPVQDATLLEEAKLRFEQTIEVLHQLDHPQLPKFKQVLDVSALSGAGGQIFLVQDYAPGPSYQSLLQDRKQVGGRFHEVEINQLLYQLLPVLSYLHERNMFHRDICPENIILRQTDGLPVLVSFGSVKALAASVRSQLGIEGVAEIGKEGYIPPEQVGKGSADATTDLYGLAATLLVLANGEKATALRDENGIWIGFENLSPQLSQVLRRMLSPDSDKRFASADDVLSALQVASAKGYEETTTFGNTPLDGEPGASMPGTSMYSGAVPIGLAGGIGAASGAIAAGMTEVTGYDTEGFSAEGYDAEGYSREDYETANYAEGPIIEDAAIDTTVEPIGGTEVINPMSPITPTVENPANAAETYEPDIDDEITAKEGDKQALIGLVALLGTAGLLLLFFLPRLGLFPFGNRTQTADSNGQRISSGQSQLRDGEFYPEEQARRSEIVARREELGISEETFNGIVNELFYQEYPVLLTSGPDGGIKTLSTDGTDEPMRIRWDHIAIELLDNLQDNLSSQSINGIGTYTGDSRDDWRSRLASTNVPERALEDLAAARFFRLYPEQEGRDFISQPIGQIYYAIGDDLSRSIANGSAVESIQYGQGAFSRDVRGQLAPGEGRIYTLALTSGQLLRLNLNAPNESTLLSLYPPNDADSSSAIVSASEQSTWSGALSETGSYSVVVVNRADGPIEYVLATSVDNVTSAPVPDTEPDDVEENAEDGTEDGTEDEPQTNTQTDSQIDLNEAPVAPPRVEERSENEETEDE